MKKQFILVSILSFVITLFIQAQSLPTGFEEWSETTLEQLPEPLDFWYSNNSDADSFYYGGGPVKKTSDSYSGDYAIRLETIIDHDGDTIPGYISPHPGIWEEGLVITGTPDSLIGYYKCNIMPNDTARAYIHSQNGTVYGDIKFTPSMNTDNYARFAMPMHIQGTDTIELVLNSSTKDWDKAIPGTWIQFDSLYLKGAGLDPGDTLGNNDFERWAAPSSYSFKNPVGWSTFNYVTEFWGDTSFIFESDDAYSGSSSISLVSDTLPGPHGNSEPVMLYNGKISGDAPSGGFITNQWPDSIVAYCKYSPVGSDSAVFAVINGSADLNSEGPTAQNSVIKMISATPSFEKFVFDMTSITTDSSDPDSVLIVISSSNIMAESFEIGSQLWVDDITLYPQIVNDIKISTANGDTVVYIDSTLQMHAEVFPNYALNDSVAWSVDDENFATIDHNGLLTGVSTGTVTVTATSTDGTDVEGTKNITVSAGSSINSDINNTDISIYPIPAESVINIASENAITGIAKLINLSGVTIIESSIDNTNYKIIDISGLQSGVYFIRLEINNELMNQKIIVK